MQKVSLATIILISEYKNILNIMLIFEYISNILYHLKEKENDKYFFNELKHMHNGISNELNT